MYEESKVAEIITNLSMAIASFAGSGLDSSALYSISGLSRRIAKIANAERKRLAPPAPEPVMQLTDTPPEPAKRGRKDGAA